MSAEGPRRPDDAGLDRVLDLEWVEVTPTRVVARLRIDARHLQPYGIVHGGIYCTAAESAASLGAHMNASQRDPEAGAVGLENHTTFLRAARAGTEVEFEATPLHAGRRTQAWQVFAREVGTGRELATSRVRLMVVKSDSL